MKRVLKSIIKYVAGFFVVLLLAMIIFLALFSERIKEEAHHFLEESIEGNISYSKVSLSFFTDFPHLTLNLREFSLSNLRGFGSDTLFSSERLSVGINPLSALSGEIVVSRIIVKGGAAFYRDSSQNSYIALEGVDYFGKALYKKGVLTLKSKIVAEELSVMYDKVDYIEKRDIVARLTTEIRPKEMLFNFRRSDFSLSGLSSSFTGELLFAKERSHINLEVVSKKSTLKELLGLLPKEYNDWYNSLKVKGDVNFIIALSGESNNSESLLPNLSAKFYLSNGYIKEKNFLNPIEKITLNSTLFIPKFNLDSAYLSIDTLSFKLLNNINSLSFRSKGLDNPSLKLKAKGVLDLSQLIGALGISSWQLKGELDYNIDANGLYDHAKGAFPICNASVNIRDGFIQSPYIDIALQQIESQTKLTNSTGKIDNLELQIKPLEFNFGENPFSMELNLKEFDNLSYRLLAKGLLDIDGLSEMFNINEASLKGSIETDLFLEGKVVKDAPVEASLVTGRGMLNLRDFEYKSKEYPHPFTISRSNLNFEKERAILSATTIDYGGNSFVVEGYLANFMDYLFSKGVIDGALSFDSKSINIDDFRYLILDDHEKAEDDDSQPEVIQLPERVNLSLKARISEVYYKKIRATNFRGEAAIADRSLYLNGTGINIAGASFLLDAAYTPSGRDSALVKLRARADSFNIARAYKEIPLLAQLFSSAQYMNGVISIDYNISSQLDRSMNPVLSSIKGGGVIGLEDVRLKGFKLFGSLSSATGRDSLNNPNLKGVIIKSSISNNVVNIERTKMRIFGFRPRFEGQTTLDGQLNLKCRIGLPPFGLFGIPLTIKGTMENPLLYFKRDKAGEIIQEKSDDPDLN